MGAAQHRHVSHAWQLHVVGVFTLTGDEPGVLLTFHRGSNDAGWLAHYHGCPPKSGLYTGLYRDITTAVRTG